MDGSAYDDLTLEAARLREQVEQLQAEREELLRTVRESEGRYRGLFSSMLDGYALHEMIYDDEGAPIDYRFLEVNPAFERLTGLQADDLIGRTVREVMPDIEERWIETYGRIATEGGTVRFENFSATLDRHYEVVAYQPKPGHFACAFNDVTERRQLEEQVRHSQKMEAIGTLAGGVAHDFNNLLTGILGYANVLKLGAETGDDVFRAADVIERAATRAAGLAQQLLGFARKGKLQDRPVDLRRVVGDVVSILSHSLDKSIEIQQRFDDAGTAVQGDPGQLQQVAMNLAVNAADAMPGGGELIFDLHGVEIDDGYCLTHPEIQPGSYLMLSVTDNGAGIAPDVQARIFEPFFTTKEPGKGTGMGLATTYGIVKNHGGSIEVYSEPGRGTTFKVYLPPARTPEADWTEPASIETLHGEGHVLVVDDEETVCTALQAMLGEVGYEVDVVHDASQAIEHFLEHHDEIDLVILDWSMPDMGGADCFRVLKQLDPDVRALLITGHAFNGAAQQVLDEGMAGFVQKPFDTRTLAKAVARAIRGPGVG